MSFATVLNQNQGVLELAGIVIAAGISWWVYKRQQHPDIAQPVSVEHSPHINAGGNITAGGNISVGNHVVTPKPEFPKPQPLTGFEIVSDHVFKSGLVEIDEEFRTQMTSFNIRFGGVSSATQQASQALQREATKKRAELQRKKGISNSYYTHERDALIDYYDHLYKATQSDVASRNLLESGIGQQELEEVNRKKDRDLANLKQRYGVST